MRRLRILLLQARNPGDAAKKEEVRSFARTCRLEVDQLRSHDLLEGPPSLAKIRAHDALMVGGSGEYTVSERNLPGFERLLEVLTEVTEVGHPTFASCFGFQLLVEALGGSIVHDPENIQTGTFRLELTTAGRDDSLFSHLPQTFNAQLGRKDRASRLPAGIPNLVTSRRAPFQALRIPGQPVWATQFHPELDRETNRGRFLNYLDGYGGHLSEEEQRGALAAYRDSPEASELLPRFLELVFGRR